jgi:hypothetical protein
MNVFDLLFLASCFTALITLIVVACFVLRREFGRAARILWKLAAGVGAYFAVVILVSLLSPRRVFKPGARQCFDDWCIGVDGFRQAPEAGGVAYSVDLRLSSRARRVSQREKNVTVYLTDDHSSRYNAIAASSTGPFDVLLEPQESVIVSRSFLVPAQAKNVGLVIAHEGGFPMGRFIIGYDSWFRKPTVVPLRDEPRGPYIDSDE